LCWWWGPCGTGGGEAGTGRRGKKTQSRHKKNDTTTIDAAARPEFPCSSFQIGLRHSRPVEGLVAEVSQLRTTDPAQLKAPLAAWRWREWPAAFDELEPSDRDMVRGAFSFASADEGLSSVAWLAAHGLPAGWHRSLRRPGSETPRRKRRKEEHAAPELAPIPEEPKP
jgi:hypothetical protein